MPIQVVMNEFLMVKTHFNFIQLQTEKPQCSPLEDLYWSQDLIGLLEPLQLKCAKYLFDKHVAKMIASCVFLDDIRMAKLWPWVILKRPATHLLRGNGHPVAIQDWFCESLILHNSRVCA